MTAFPLDAAAPVQACPRCWIGSAAAILFATLCFL